MYRPSLQPIFSKEEVAAMIKLEGFMDIIALHCQGLTCVYGQ